MASTYVNDLRLNEMATGDGSGTWGTTTNTNLELIAEAFSYGTEVITTNADTHTTTIADGSTDPGRSLYLKYTGTLDSACTITIGPDTVSKVWIIENGTSGSQDIILSQGSGANITIPAGDTKVVYSDGAGAGAAFVDAFASLSVVDLKVQDDLTVTGDITGTLATAAQPNITSVGTLTALTGGTGDLNWDSNTLFVDSSANKVGIGTSSPDAPLEIDGGSTDNTVLHLTSGTANTYLKLSDSNTTNGGFIGYATEDMFLLTNNTERLRINSSGNVGIGNSVPLGKLTISNAAGANAPSTVTAANTYLQLGSDDYGPSNNGKFMIGFGFTDATNTNSPAYIGYEEVSTSGDTYGDLTFYTRSVTTDTAPTERLRIDASGNVGIGVVPSSWAANTLDALQLGASIGVGNLTARVDGINAVGLGLNWYYGGGATNTYVASSFATNYSQEAGTHRWFHAASGTAGDALTFTESMRIDASGNVRVNNTSGLDGQFSSLAGAFYAGAFANTSAAYAPIYSWNRATSGNNLFCEFFTGSLGSLRGTIDYNRGAGLVRYNTSSDATLKNIIGDSDGVKSVEILNSTRIREFAWKDDETQKPQIGVIAQELYETYKGAVSVGGDLEKTDDEGNVTTEYQPWAVDKTAFTFHLVAGWQVHEKIIQEQQALIESLEARITALES
jgi:hypothetical protein